MTENEYRQADIRAKKRDHVISLLGAVAVVFSILLGLRQIEIQSKAQVKAMNHQWQQKFYEERLLLYRRATEAAGRVAALKMAGTGGEPAEAAWIEFRTLFWGPMCMTEGPDVEQAMYFFNEAVEKKKSGEVLQQLALRLSHVAKNETNDIYLEGKSTASRIGPNEVILKQMRAYVERE